MLRPDIVRFSLVTAAVLIPQAAAAQPPRVDLRAHWGYTHVLDDTPPQAWVGGGSLTAAVGPNLRLGVEVLHANMFGKYSHYKERARLITYKERARLITPLPCAAEALFRSLLAGIPLGEAARHQLEYRSGRPLVPDQAPLPGPGSTHRLAPDSAFDRVCWLRLLSRPDVGAVQFRLELPGFFRSGLVAAPQCSPGSAMTAQPFPPQRPLATEGSPGEYVPGKLCASHGTGRARHRLYPQTFKTGPIRCCR